MTTTDDGGGGAVPNETPERMYIKREKKTVPEALNAFVRARRRSLSVGSNWQGAQLLMYLATEG